MDETSIKDLFDRYFFGKCSPEEQVQLMELFSRGEHEQLLKSLLEEKFATYPEEMVMRNENAAQISNLIFSISNSNKIYHKDHIHQASQPISADLQSADIPSLYSKDVHRVHFLKTAWFRYTAAIVILLLGSLVYFLNFFPGKSNDSVTATPVPLQDILPGGNRAVLTLADGRTIVLDSATNGQLAEQAGSQIIKQDDHILYNVAKDATVAYNTLSTPRGGQYQVALPDGTKVWLNAASSITYPTAFVEQNRKVSINGEVYFEVAKNKSQPFIVELNNSASVEVLGTHFNINSYTNEENQKITLLEGSVKVTQTAQSKILTSGQQAQVTNNITVTDNINTEEVMAWKNERFSFNNTDLKAIMRQVTRWYDVEVVYKGNISSRKFTGDIPRTAKLSELLNLFKVNNIHFVIDAEHKKMTVMP